jgi:hypothetical protein
MRSLVIITLAIVLGVASADAASAETRTLTLTDPQDAPPALSGLQDDDVESVAIAYDTAGVLSVTARLYRPPNPNADLSLSFNLTGKLDDLDRSKCSVLANPWLSGTLWLRSGHGTASLFEATGLLDAPLTRLDDRTFQVTFTNSGIAGLDFRCADVSSLSTWFYEFSFCNFAGCPRKSAPIDDVLEADWFTGFAPKPLAEIARPFWKITARKDVLGDLAVRVANSAVTSTTQKLSYRVCVVLSKRGKRCQAATLFAVAGSHDFRLDRRVARPVTVMIEVGGVVQARTRFRTIR